MKCKLKLTLEAKADLKEIWRYIAEDSLVAADDFLDSLYSKCEKAADTGFYGRTRPDLGDGIYSYPYRKFMLYFQKKGRVLYVVRVLRGSRDQSRHLGS